MPNFTLLQFILYGTAALILLLLVIHLAFTVAGRTWFFEKRRFIEKLQRDQQGEK